MKALAIILGHARHAMKNLGKGHREQVYGKAMQVSLSKSGVAYRSEVCCPIVYMDEIIGHGRADFVIGEYVVEIKATRGERLSEAGDQLEKYLKSLRRIERKQYKGVVLNFNQATGRVDCHEERVVSRFFLKRSAR